MGIHSLQQQQIMQGHPKLLYLSCEQKDHQRRCLDQVCIDDGCDKHSLICSYCSDSKHKGHKSMLLADFIDKLEQLRFRQNKESATLSLMHSVKIMKAGYIEKLASMKNLLETLLKKLDEGVKHYDRAELRLSKQFEREPLQFQYNPNLELQQLNSSLQLAVNYYRKSSTLDDLAKVNVSVSEMEIKHTQIASLLQKVSDAAADSTILICQTLDSLTSASLNPKWSSVLKHSQIVRQQPNIVKKLAGEYSVFALLDIPLQGVVEWKLRVAEIRNWVGIGVISEQQARKVGFNMKPNGSWLRNLSMIYSGGGPGAYGKELLQGKGFTFGKGDTIKVTFDVESRRVKFDNCKGQQCESVANQPQNKQDSYYGYVVLQEGSRIEIVQ